MKEKIDIKTIEGLPQKPGVYIFKDKAGKIIYVGKAKDLRARVKSYFLRHDDRAQVEFLVKRARDVEYIVTDTEKEALLLENTLIKKHRPRYNIFLKDDKTYPSIKISMRDEFPGIYITRRVIKDGSTYFGPFTSSSACRELTEQVIICSKIRTCSNTVFANRMRPCLEYDLKRCTAPCVKKISKKSYDEQVKEAILLLKGQRRDILNKIKEKMRSASDRQDYESAAMFRDAIQRMHDAFEKQKVVGFRGSDADYIGVAMSGSKVCFAILEVRGGLLIGKREYLFKDVRLGLDEVVYDFLIQYYIGRDIIPNIYLSHLPIEKDFFQKVLVPISLPVKGKNKSLIDLATRNASDKIERDVDRGREYDDLAVQLAARLKLSHPPVVIECLDISNISGKDAYGSLICFENGTPNKSRYRLYSIRSMFTPDDYAMMREVLHRRFADSDIVLSSPDLLLVDGGKGQLNCAIQVLNELGVDIPIASIAKAKDSGCVDELYLPNRKDSLRFKKGNIVLLFLMRLRDEAHRFGIKAHRRRREKIMTQK